MLARILRALAPETGRGAAAGVAADAGRVSACRFARKLASEREDDLIQDQLDDQFGSRNCYTSRRRQVSVVDGRVRSRVDQAWHAVTMRTPHIRDTLIEQHGLDKTGEDVFDQGRRAIIYYECDPGSEVYVQHYFQSARTWLSHRLGQEMHLKRRPRFEFVQDGLSPKAEGMFNALSHALADTAPTPSGAQQQPLSVHEPAPAPDVAFTDGQHSQDLASSSSTGWHAAGGGPEDVVGQAGPRGRRRRARPHPLPPGNASDLDAVFGE